MYKVHTYCTGEIKTAGKHELVKGLPDEDFVDLFDCFRPEIAPTTATFTAPYVASPIPHHVPQNTTVPQVQKEFLPRPAPTQSDSAIVAAPITAPLTESKRFAKTDLNPDQFRKSMANVHTVNKTKGHLKVLRQFLHMKDEHRHIEDIPPAELDVYLSEFVVRVRQTNGEQYEPSTLRGIISSIDR